MRLLKNAHRISQISATVLAMSSTKRSRTYMFDAHNHVHLSMQNEVPSLSKEEIHQCSIDDLNFERMEDSKQHARNIYQNFSSSFQDGECQPIGCIAMMSTQPRDFPIVQTIAQELKAYNENEDLTLQKGVIECYGIHPWMLQQATHDFEHLPNDESDFKAPKWVPFLKHYLISNPASHVGEIGLDSARWEMDEETKEKLPIPMDLQIEAFEAQMHIAADLKRSVSIHTVHCWGVLMDSLNRIKAERTKLRKEQRQLRKTLKRQLGFETNKDELRNIEIQLEELGDDTLVFPPCMYFHAFGGKSALVDQLDAITRDKASPQASPDVYFGFAPVINFTAPKTMSVMKKIGLKRLVIESDLENYKRVSDDLRENVKFIANCFDVSEDEVIEQTMMNAENIYFR